MSKATIIKAVVIENSAIQIVGRITGLNDAQITQASLTSIACEVRDVLDPTVVVGTPTADKITDVFDVYQMDALWTRLFPHDTVGYNFKHLLLAGTFPLGDKTYQVDYLFTPTTPNEAFRVQAEIKTVNALSV